jgi:hypothetical protein
LPIQLPEKNKEMFLFDLHTVGYWVSKNATKIADSVTPESRGSCPVLGEREGEILSEHSTHNNRGHLKDVD